MRNDYRVEGDTAVILLKRRDGSVWETFIDRIDLPIADSIEGNWFGNLGTNRYSGGILRGKSVLLHRLILGINDPMVPVDHLDHNGLNNRRSNIKIATFSENSWNMNGVRRDSKSGVRGVFFDRASGKWIAAYQLNLKKVVVGRFDAIEDAEIAIREARLATGLYSRDNIVSRRGTMLYVQ